MHSVNRASRWTRAVSVWALGTLLLGSFSNLTILAQSSKPGQTYLGFDRNEYPGDENLKALHKAFAYAGYWLNSPPGATSNSWYGKRRSLESAGFGFLVLFNGKTYAQIKAAGNPSALGKSDAQVAVAQAKKEGFPLHTLIFVDQEEGGRLLPEQQAYLFGWIDEVTSLEFNAGVYCLAIPFREGDGTVVNTADNIRQNAGKRKISFWVVNDACPPSPGCAFPSRPPAPSTSGIAYADVWQYAQSPRRKDVAASCSNYDSDSNCYAPAVNRALHVHVDVNAAYSNDPSHGRTRN